MKGCITHIEKEALANDKFRKVLYTDEKMQLVVMSLLPKEDIGLEKHDVDQFIRVEEGNGAVVLDGKEQSFTEGYAVVVPAGVAHNIVNTSAHDPMKLYTLYAPAHHKHGTIHDTKADAMKDEH